MKGDDLVQFSKKTNYCYRVEYLFSRIYALTFKPIRNTFQRGVDPQYMKSLEERYSITLPTFLSMIHMII